MEQRVGPGPNALAKKMLAAALLACVFAGCYAPVRSPGIPAAQLPDHFRYPMRTSGEPLNYSLLAASAPPIYTLGTGDVLEITIPDLIQAGEARPFQVQLLETGEVFLPRVGPVQIGGLSLADAQRRINEALARGYLRHPGASLTLVEKGKINVVVLGAVEKPGVYALNRFENDVAHALASAGGLAEDAGDVIEVHRRAGLAAGVPIEAPPTTYGPPMMPPEMHPYPQPPMPGPQLYGPEMNPPVPPLMHNTGGAPQAMPRAVRPAVQSNPNPFGSYRTQARPAAVSTQPIIRGQSPAPGPGYPAPYTGPAITYSPGQPDSIVRIPLRGDFCSISPSDVLLNPEDVVVVPRKVDEVFYVVGPLSESNRIRFTVGDRDREIGNGLLLPPDREVDVVTAVAMAGYIDPIDSPTTVTVHRMGDDGMPLLVRVDLIKARYSPQETILIQPGDIIYLNPDPWWYSRRMFDRLIDNTVGRFLGD